MKKEIKRSTQKLKVRQRLTLKMILVWTTGIMIITVAITGILNFSGIKSASASGKNKINIINVEDQELINDMSVQKPQLRLVQPENGNTVFITRIKTDTTSSIKENNN